MSISVDQLLQQCLPPYRLPPAEVQRIFHGRGGAYPGLEHVVIDWIPPVVLVTLYAEEPKSLLQELAAGLMASQLACESVVVQYRHDRAGPMEALLGKMPAQLVVEEQGLTFGMSFGTNRNTGFFLDMRNGRQWLRECAAGKRVLNLFAYTCGFSVAAMAGGADSVVNVDISSPALSAGRENHLLNQQDLTRVRFEKLEIFRSFGRLAKWGPYDLLVCDPPTLQKGSVDIARDYPKIIRRLDRLMAPESELLMCFNAPHLDEGFLLQAMATDAPDFRYVERIRPPEAFVEPGGGAMKAMRFRRDR